MLSLFKSSKKIVQKIHNEVDTAQDRLLQEAEKIISEINIPVETKIIEKANRLKSLGFVNASEVKGSDHLQSKIRNQQVKMIKTKEQAELLLYYKLTYPFHKFLTEEELQRICDKYELIYAPVASYIKDVPEKNIKEMETSAPLHPDDTAMNRIMVKINTFWPQVPQDLKEILSGEMEYFTERAERKYRDKQNTTKFEPTVYGMMQLAIERGYTGNFDPGAMLFKDATVKKISKDGLFIAAPKSYFNLEGLTKETKHGWLSVGVSTIKDPIVFRHCRGKMIRVETKWGLEASDEVLVNEKMN